MVETLSHCAASIVLVPGPGADAATRRPGLVQCFERFGLLPDYECDLMELDPAAVCLRHVPSAGAGELTPKVETAFARLNRALGDLKRIASNPRLGVRRRAPPYRRTGGKIAQTQRIPARVEIAERAEANSAEIARAPGGPDIARAISSSGKTGENSLEKAASTRDANAAVPLAQANIRNGSSGIARLRRTWHKCDVNRMRFLRSR